MINKLIRILTAVLLMSTVNQQAAAISINFDYSFDTNNFFSDPARRDVLSAAGNFFESVLLDDLTAITPGGTNVFNVNFLHPGTGATQTINSFSVAADTLTVFAGGRSLSGLGLGGPGGFSAGGTTTFVDNAVTRGESTDRLDIQGSNATEFAPWGGAITFNTGATWYIDPDTSTTESFSGNDFYSVALHEIGHLLGFGLADSWDNLVDSANDLFTGSAATSIAGGNVALDMDESHWLAGTVGMVDGAAQEAAMDPSLTVGTRKLFTDLDLAGLDDIGWDIAPIAPVPLPPALYLFGAGLLGLFSFARKRA